ncbi:MAG: hypothetical protein Q8Q85_15200 [Gemmatimonadales bacterium]|nr:hypothetical protein [Gemmatimonadales bacterium]
MRVASLEALVRAFNSEGVPFIVVGGLAVNAHGYGRFTQDVDLVIELTPEHVRATFRALASLGYRPRVPVTAEQFSDPAQRARWIAEKQMQVLSFDADAHRETPVDIFVTEPFDFGEEYRLALVEELAPAVAVRIVRLPALLRMKAEAGRAIDRADIAELRLLHGDPAGEYNEG